MKAEGTLYSGLVNKFLILLSLGYREVKTTGIVAEFLESLGLDVERNIAVTGCRSFLNKNSSGPCIALMGGA